MAGRLFGPVDLSGNWEEEGARIPCIRTREPPVVPGRTRRFRQVLSLPAGIHRIRFRYDRHTDNGPGLALGGSMDPFRGFSVDGRTLPLHFRAEADRPHLWTAEARFRIAAPRTVPLEIRLASTRVLETEITCDDGWPLRSRWAAVRPERGGQCLFVHGVPFLVDHVERQFLHAGFTFDGEVSPKLGGTLADWRDGMVLPCGDTPARTACFLGMVHRNDLANGSWYSPKGDHGYSHFIGDRAGEIGIEWQDGSRTDIPLVFGFNLWYGRPWDILWHDNAYSPDGPWQNFDSTLFEGRDDARDRIARNLRLADGIRPMAGYSCNARYLFPVDLEGRVVRSIAIRGTDDLHEYPVIIGVSLETDAPSPILAPLPDPGDRDPCLIPVTPGEIRTGTRADAQSDLQHLFYDFTEEVPVPENPERPEGYFGPEFDFRGCPDAVRAATFLHFNGPECAAHIADRGTGCSSSTMKWVLPNYTMGIGAWRTHVPLYDGVSGFLERYRSAQPGTLPGTGEAWTRGAGELIREATAFGYDRFVPGYIDWLDRCLFAEATPPHWNRVAGQAWDRAIPVGDTIETGNRENDGHGICMWGRAMYWHWMGRPIEWNRAHWDATRASVEWIRWQLDHDTIRPGMRKDVLFTESECAHGDYDIYSSFNCLHGLRLAIRMAEQLGMRDEADAWHGLSLRLARGILDHLVDKGPFGPVWHTEPHCDWQEHAHALVPLHLSTEGFTYTPFEDLDPGDEFGCRFLEIDRNTYRWLRSHGGYDALRMFGYGQGMMLQGAALMDCMADVEGYLSMMVTHGYLGQFGRWVSPEGIILHRSGRFHVAVNAYAGQDSHVADASKAVRLLLGFDDNRPERLRLVPRYPSRWHSMRVDGFPVLTGRERQATGYRYERFDNGQVFSVRFGDRPAAFDLRLGPIPDSRTIGRVACGGLSVPFRVVSSGDSRWAWIRDLGGKEVRIELEYGP